MRHQEIDWNTDGGFTEVYSLYAKKMYRLAYTYLQDTHHAQEIVQKIFLNLWERRDQLKIDVPIENYLIKATKYAVFRCIEKETKNQYCSVESEVNQLQTDSLMDQIIFNESVRKVEKLVDALPAKRKNIFLLSREYGLKNKEIAAKLDISEKSVEYHIKHSLIFLKKKF